MVKDDLLLIAVITARTQLLLFLPASLLVGPQPSPVWGVSSSRMQHFICVLAEFPSIPAGPFLQPVEAENPLVN